MFCKGANLHNVEAFSMIYSPALKVLEWKNLLLKSLLFIWGIIAVGKETSRSVGSLETGEKLQVAVCCRAGRWGLQWHLVPTAIVGIGRKAPCGQTQSTQGTEDKTLSLVL